MNEDKYGFCKTFVKNADRETVMNLLSALLGGTVERRTLRLPGLLLDVLPNPDALLGDEVDDFVRWPVLVEAEPDSPEDDRQIVSTMSRIIIALWDTDHPAVAACDFEDELPWGGGIRRIRE